MDKQITRAEARKLLKCKTNVELALKLGCWTQQVHQWRDDEPIPRPRQWQIRAMVAESALADNTPRSNIRRP